VGEQAQASGPDFAAGIAADDCPEGTTVAGRVGDDGVLLSRIDGELYAIGSTCTHYGGALAKGLIGDGEVRCPLHHACFDLKTGEVLRAPALDPVDRWKVEVEGDRIFVRQKLEAVSRTPTPQTDVRKIVIVGGGAAGLACANELRHLGYDGQITILSADADPPCDRPNLSKDYLAGTAPEEWIPLRPADWYTEHRIDLRLNSPVRMIDTTERAAELEDGERFPFDRLLLATGSEPRRLEEQGFSEENCVTLRTLQDARDLIERAKPGAKAVIIGSSFIGLEAAAALRTRKVEVSVVSPEHMPFERIFGAELGSFIQKLHEDHGVRFHLGTVVARFEDGAVVLASGERLPADFVLVGVGVVPRITLAEAAGFDVDRAVLVNEHLETSCSGIFAAGDIASYPNPNTGERMRIEHWTVAERQGQVAAANMLGLKQRFESAPFFWTEQYGVTVRYVGHAKDWDDAAVDGEIGTAGSVIRYRRGGKHLATASINCDHNNLEDELRLEGSKQDA
jgi:NADPH-dependent 2,4-dienoyl-CoA reductase/sulfur reductase-like enzyme/nitrite reductase/ring-hydroxylating ferredoxin subunit